MNLNIVLKSNSNERKPSYTRIQKHTSKDLQTTVRALTFTLNRRINILNDKHIHLITASDLINIGPRQRSQTRRLLELIQVFKLRRLFGTKTVNSEPYAVTYSDTRLDGLVVTLQLILGLAMLNGPLWVLSYVGNATARLAFISSSIVLFLLLVTLLTLAKVPEALGATAAYSAVLMVFWQVNPR